MNKIGMQIASIVLGGVLTAAIVGVYINIDKIKQRLVQIEMKIGIAPVIAKK